MANISFYTAVSGMKTFQQMMDVTANNLANVNTYGFKKQRASFEDLMYTRVNQHKNYAPEADPQGGENVDLVGHGVRMGSTQLLYSATGYVSTSVPLDFAIEGEALFAVNKNGTTEYTRNGAFRMSQDGNSLYLVTDDNARVLDSKGKEIKLTLDKNGLPVFEDLQERIGLYNFSNPYGLIPVGGSRFVESATSGAGVLQKDNSGASKTHQYMLENSATDMGSEMVEMITAQRAFQMNSRVVQTADEIDEMVNNLRR